MMVAPEVKVAPFGGSDVATTTTSSQEVSWRRNGYRLLCVEILYCTWHSENDTVDPTWGCWL